MPYSQLAHAIPQASPDARRFVQEFVDPLMRDVRAMLEHPAADGVAFNLSAAIVLCAVIAGVARVFDPKQPDNQEFKNLCTRMDLRHPSSTAVTSSQDFGEALYHVYRCNLVHSAGLNLRNHQAGKVSFPPIATSMPRSASVVRGATLPIGGAKLDELENLSSTPAWLPPILDRKATGDELCVEALYRGVRALVVHLAQAPMLQAAANSVLLPQAATLTTQVMSSTPVLITTSTFGSIPDKSP